MTVVSVGRSVGFAVVGAWDGFRVVGVVGCTVGKGVGLGEEQVVGGVLLHMVS
jgi:hypothetical protein